MTDKKNDRQMQAYSAAVKSGLYAKKSGLVGKYDNVRRYWEDETTRIQFQPYLRRLIKYRSASMRRLRVLDLGCGGADGYELLTGTRSRDPSLWEVEVDLLTPDVLGFYKGIDLNKDLLNQARDIYSDNPKMVFDQGDFTKGLPIDDGEKPYDLYFTSYGTCSHHNDDETLVRMLAAIARKTKDYCIIVCDWLGRYSYEWQTLWTNDLSENRNMDYVVSYIYEKEEREQLRDQLQHLTLRLMSRKEVDDVVDKASEDAGVEIKPLTFFDRSVFTGRHMDTAEYNPHAQPIRQAVNSLHESNLRTDLSSLLINYVPKQDFEFLNEYFDLVQMCWNRLVHYIEELLSLYEDGSFKEKLSPIPASYPPALHDMMVRMRQVVESIGWLGIGLPRENIIEPQLGYALSYMVKNLQQGQGCAHGLCGIFEVDKR